MLSSDFLFHQVSNKYTMVPCPRIESGWHLRVNHQGIHNVGRHTISQHTPTPATICASKHTKIKCPCIDSGWQGWVNCQGKNTRTPIQVSVGRTPGPAAIRTFEHATG